MGCRCSRGPTRSTRSCGGPPISPPRFRSTTRPAGCCASACPRSRNPPPRSSAAPASAVPRSSAAASVPARRCLLPPILDEFGWERGVTAGAFSFGFLVSAVFSPLVGRLMDRRGPRVVIEMGVLVMAAGLMLAPLVSRPRHLYATLGVLVGGGADCLGYTGQWAVLPNRFGRRRRLALSLAVSGGGAGS